MRKKKQFNTFS